MAHPEDEDENAGVRSVQERLGLLCTVRYPENSVRCHGAEFWVVRGQVLTTTSGSWKGLMVSSVWLLRGLCASPVRSPRHSAPESVAEVG